MSKQGPGDRSGDQWGCLVVPGRHRLQGAVVDREMRKGMGKETLGDDSEGWGKFKDVPWNAGRALYIKQVGIALQGNSRHTAPGGRYVMFGARIRSAPASALLHWVLTSFPSRRRPG